MSSHMGVIWLDTMAQAPNSRSGGLYIERRTFYMANPKEEKKIRNRYFCAILYEEDPNYKKYMNNIQNNFKEVTWIDHARDIKEDSEEEELKKKHTHILFKVGENARHRNAIAKIIDIAPNYIERMQQRENVIIFHTRE